MKPELRMLTSWNLIEFGDICLISTVELIERQK